MLALGAELLKAFGDAATHDLLANWMARHLAEKLTLEKSARGAEKLRLREQCAELILKLWEHRHALPDGARPYESFEAVFQALHELSSSNPRNPYLRSAPRVKAPKEVTELVGMAGKVDDAANALIRYLLALAVRRMPAKDKRWASLRSAVTHEPLDIQIVYRLLDDEEKLLDGKKRLQAKEIEDINRMLTATRTLEGLIPEFTAHFEERMKRARET